jgi:hypothetical protein
MASDLKPSGLDFGVVIAFVAPGFVALQGASYHMLTVQAWMAAASEKEQSVGVFLFVLLASLSMGLVVSGIRALVLDNLLQFGQLLRQHAVPKLSLDWSKVDDKKLPVLITIRDAHYRHYQFYANTLVAMVFWAFSRASTSRPGMSPQQWALISAILLALLFSARDSFLRYVNAVNRAFGP